MDSHDLILPVWAPAAGTPCHADALPGLPAWRTQTLIMGILNTTPDSFSDGGKNLDPAVAIEQGRAMFAHGAHIVDVGGESTRPGAQPVSAEEELRRVLPVVEALTAAGCISIDTMKPTVADAALRAGATLLNDVSGLADPRMRAVAADRGAWVCLMHMQGDPRTMQNNPTYRDVVDDVLAFLEARAALAIADGVAPSKILVDPGFGFGKTLAQNYALLANLHRFQALGFPVVLGTSRKSMLGGVVNKPAADRLLATAASVAVGIANGASMVRVHDVTEMADVVAVVDAMRRNAHAT